MQPTPPIKERGMRNLGFRLLARLSCVASIAAVSIFVASVFFFDPKQWARIRLPWLVLALLVIGLLAGVASLAGTWRQSSRGVLLPSVIGVGIAVVMAVFVRVVPSFSGTPLHPAHHFPEAQRFQFSSRGFHLDLPDGFKQILVESNFAAVDYYFSKGDPNDDEPDVTLLIDVKSAKLLPGKLSFGDISKDFKGVTTEVDWRGLLVNMVSWAEKKAETSSVSFLIQLPLKDEMVTLAFEGPAIPEGEVLKLAANMLSTVEGDTWW